MSNNYMKYKGYFGSAEIDLDSGDCHGRLLFISDVITYSAEDGKGLRRAFEDAVEDYLETCRELGKKPETPCKGVFNVRVSPSTHRDAALYASKHGLTLNGVVIQALESLLIEQKRHGHQTFNITINHGIRTQLSGADNIRELQYERPYAH